VFFLVVFFFLLVVVVAAVCLFLCFGWPFICIIL
jgi:hypothetical protein